MSAACSLSFSELKICILRSRLPSSINHVTPWICDKKIYICALGTILCHKYMQLNFLEQNPQVGHTLCAETGATGLGNSVPPGSAWTLGQPLICCHGKLKPLIGFYSRTIQKPFYQRNPRDGPYKSRSGKTKTWGTSRHGEGVVAALKWRGIRSHQVGRPDSCFNPWIPRFGPQIAMKSPFLPFSLLCWVVGWKGWWMGNCTVSHRSYPFTTDRNRCHLFWKTGATGFHLAHGLLFINSFPHFLFHSPFFLCCLYSFLHRPLS
jgi:hypothetical protein